MPSEFATKIIDMLSPSIGKYLATKVVRTACETAKLDIEKIGKGQRKIFCEELKSACLDLGPQIAESIKEHAEALA